MNPIIRDIIEKLEFAIEEEDWDEVSEVKKMIQEELTESDIPSINFDSEQY